MLRAVDLVDLLPAELVARYNAVPVQRDRILAVLRAAGPAGVLGPDLARLCFVPSITKRVSELRKRGHVIDTEPGHVVGDDGSVSACARYVLHSGDSVQGDLFKAAEGGGGGH